MKWSDFWSLAFYIDKFCPKAGGILIHTTGVFYGQKPYINTIFLWLGTVLLEY